ncbi:MAG: aldehyde ferredoxin oxidoreductase family protein [Candidatus Bathyarchaeia archaeon]
MVKGGYMGKILRVDLTTEKVTEETFEEGTLRKFVGGLGLATKIMYDEVSPNVRPFDPENRVVFMSGPLSGTAAPASSRHVVYTLNETIPRMCSPGFAGGFFAVYLKIKNGYDGIIVQGAAKNPTYLWIHDGQTEFLDAGKIWGKETFETEDMTKEQVGDPEASVSCIGPAGEKLMKGAIVLNDRRHHSTKGGAILGSKKLKAIAVGGKKKQKVPLADEKKALEVAREWRTTLLESWVGKRRSKAGNLRYWGHPKYFRERSPWILMVKNLSDPEFAYKYGWAFWRTVEASKVTPKYCFNCPIGCAYDIEIGVGPHKGKVFQQAGGAEHYEGTAGNVGVSEGGTVLATVDFLDRQGIDSCVGESIGLAFECYEKGLLTKEDTDGLELTWGNIDAARKLLKKMMNREGLGKVLAEGPKEAARIISEMSGKNAMDFAVHVKGSPIFAHDVRISFDAILGIATCNNGPILQGLGMLYDPEPDYGYPTVPYPFDPERAPLNVKLTQIKKIWEDCLGVCWFNTGCVRKITEYTPRMLSYVTGWKFSKEESDLVGERVAQTHRVFNLRRGLRAEDDFDIGPRVLNPPKAGLGKDAPIKPHLATMIRQYYKLMGWDEKTGVPLKETLARVGLPELIEDLPKISLE